MTDKSIEIFAVLPVRLRVLRLKRKLSQDELAERSGVGSKTISSFETGARIDRIDLFQLLAIAEALGTTAAEMLELSAPMVRRIERAKPPVQHAKSRPVTIFRSSDFLTSSLGENRR